MEVLAARFCRFLSGYVLMIVEIVRTVRHGH
jgi:hypothetical protein